MSTDEMRAFLASHRVLAVSGRDGAGRLTARVRPYVLSDHGVEIDLGPDMPFDLEADPRICAVVDVYPTYADIKGVIIRGAATVKNVVDGSTTVELGFDRVTSFDFRKEPPVKISSNPGSGRPTAPSQD
jgi:hypothetical protein